MPLSAKTKEALSFGAALTFVFMFYGTIGYLLYSNWQEVIEFVSLMKSPAVLFVLAITAALALFALRSIARVQYGLVEITFGIVSLASVTFAQQIDLRTTSIQLAAGMYIIVRGLDNLGLGLRQSHSHPLRPMWDKLYSERSLRRLRRRMRLFFGHPFSKGAERRRARRLHQLIESTEQQRVSIRKGLKS